MFPQWCELVLEWYEIGLIEWCELVPQWCELVLEWFTTTFWFSCNLLIKGGPSDCPVLSLFPGVLFADEFCDEGYSIGLFGEFVSSCKYSQSLLDWCFTTSLISFLHIQARTQTN